MKKLVLSAGIAALATGALATGNDPIGNLIHSLNRPEPPLTEADFRCLVDNVFHEARGESDEGRLWVAAVTLARVAHRRWPNSVCEVVYQYRQFSWTLESPSWINYNVRNEHDDYVDVEQQIVRWLWDDDIPETDIYHYARHEVDNYWTQEMTPVKQIGVHVFYE